MLLSRDKLIHYRTIKFVVKPSKHSKLFSLGNLSFCTIKKFYFVLLYLSFFIIFSRVIIYDSYRNREQSQIHLILPYVLYPIFFLRNALSSQNMRKVQNANKILLYREYALIKTVILIEKIPNR